MYDITQDLPEQGCCAVKNMNESRAIQTILLDRNILWIDGSKEVYDIFQDDCFNRSDRLRYPIILEWNDEKDYEISLTWRSFHDRNIHPGIIEFKEF